MIQKKILGLLILPLYVVAAAGSITITENTQRRLSFVFELQGFETSVSDRDGEPSTNFHFDGQNALIEAAGEVVLPAQALHVGVPATNDIQVTFTSLETRTVSLDALPGVHPEDDSAASPVAFANPWISQPKYSVTRGLRSAKLLIRPVMVNRDQRIATVLQKGVCTIEFPAHTGSSAGIAMPNSYREYFEDLLINYSVARAWHTGGQAGLTKTLSTAELSPGKNVLTFEVGDGHNDFNETTVRENGLVRINAKDILQAFSGRVRFEELTLYAGTKHPLNDTVPSPDSIPAGVEPIPVIVIDKNNDGDVDEGDYLIAYVSETSDWVFNEKTQSYEFMIHPFDDYRTYWLSREGKSLLMQPFDTVAANADDTVDYFEDHIMYKRTSALTKKHEVDGGDKWIWKRLHSNESSLSFTIDLPGATRKDSSAFLKVISGARSVGAEAIVNLNAKPLCDTCGSNQWQEINDWSGSRVRIDYEGASGENHYFEIDAVKVKYQRTLSMKNSSELLIYSAPGTGTVAYHLTDLPSEECIIVKVGDTDGQTQLIAHLEKNQTQYTFIDSAGKGARYFVAAYSKISSVNTSLKTLPNASQYVLGGCRKPTNKGDYLIITPESMLEQSIRLARHKKEIGRFSYPRVVVLDDIFRDFSGGTRDPAAIRNFLFYAVNYWSRVPEYVVLMGNGNYDHKQYTTTEQSQIPVAVHGNNCLDDFYSYLDEGEAPNSSNSTSDIFLGRISANNSTEAAAVVDKIIEMEGPEADFGAWRNRFLLVADDDMQVNETGLIPDDIDNHHVSSEEVMKAALNNNPAIDIRKVYLFEYPWDDFHEKPEAYRTLINEINNGVGMVNYFGHGSKDVWADEHIFRNESVGNLTNDKRYPIVTSFSCNVGQFDYPNRDCLSGALVKAPGAGAIAAISSARKAYATENENLATEFYNLLTDSDKTRTIGQALSLAKKNERNYNSISYSILGDPSIRLLKITDSVDVRIYDKEGKSIDSLKAMQTVTVRGTVLRNGVPNARYGTAEKPAYVQLALYNPVQDSVTRKDQGSKNVHYSLPGAPVFIGNTQVIAGKFEQTIFLPKRVSFNDPGVHLLAYAWDDENIATGLKDSIVFDGTEQIELNDTTGPRVLISPVYDNARFDGNVGFTDKVTAMLPVELNIQVYDENGIDVVGSGPDEGLTMEIVGAIAKQSISHKFKFVEGDYRNGAATIVFDNSRLKKGSYEMIITAGDLLGNISKTKVELDVTDESMFKMGKVFNYPNPVRMGRGTRFFFYQSNTHANNESYWRGTVDATIKIYTLSGKLIRIIQNAQNGHYWDLRDQAGNLLSPNIYLYRITTDVEMSELTSEEKSPVQKLVIHPPR